MARICLSLNPDKKRLEMRLAVLITCHNRMATTLKCLASLKTQSSDVSLDVYLVDDRSSDGTAEAATAAWPTINLIRGDGDLWWNGGMRLAWDTAASSGIDYDGYLWLNDDVVLFSKALSGLIADWQRVESHGEPLIVAGATQDPTSLEISYGAQCVASSRHPLRMTLVKPTGHPVRCDTFSGNCVLVSKAAFEILGNLNPLFEHIFGDLDYGFQAARNGVIAWASSEYVGLCQKNSIVGTSLDRSLPRFTRLKLRRSEEGKVHARDWRKFVRMHSHLSIFRILYTVSPYVKILLG